VLGVVAAAIGLWIAFRGGSDGSDDVVTTATKQPVKVRIQEVVPRITEKRFLEEHSVQDEGATCDDPPETVGRLLDTVSDSAAQTAARTDDGEPAVARPAVYRPSAPLTTTPLVVFVRPPPGIERPGRFLRPRVAPSLEAPPGAEPPGPTTPIDPALPVPPDAKPPPSAPPPVGHDIELAFTANGYRGQRIWVVGRLVDTQARLALSSGGLCVSADEQSELVDTNVWLALPRRFAKPVRPQVQVFEEGGGRIGRVTGDPVR
jgi:hypothetical protein